MVCKRASGEASATAPKLNLGNLFATQQRNASKKMMRSGLPTRNYTNFLSAITDS
jgi:hypothetical protein